jgi:hypothetical protein
MSWFSVISKRKFAEVDIDFKPPEIQSPIVPRKECGFVFPISVAYVYFVKTDFLVE